MLNVDAALDYLRRGWPVIPGHNPPPNGLCSCQRLNCDKPGKHPRIQWREFEHKLPSEAMVRNWWRRWPEASVIVLTGRLSGLLVVDIDPRSGGDENVHDLHLPETVTTLTGGGGEHYWFEYPASTEISIGANALPGIDWQPTDRDAAALAGLALSAAGAAGLTTTEAPIVRALPRDGLANRFGRALLADIDRALGRVAEPRSFYVPPPTFEATLELPAEVSQTASADRVSVVLAELKSLQTDIRAELAALPRPWQ